NNVKPGTSLRLGEPVEVTEKRLRQEEGRVHFAHAEFGFRRKHRWVTGHEPQGAEPRAVLALRVHHAPRACLWVQLKIGVKSGHTGMRNDDVVVRRPT